MEILLGFAIAAAIGLTGVGGGVLTAPLLIVCLDMPATVAVGTALLFVAVAKIAAVPFYLCRGQVNRRALCNMLSGGVPGVVAGSLLLTGAGNHIVLGAVGLTVAFSAALTLMRALSPAPSAVGADRPALLRLASAVIGLEVGFSSAGAGALGTLALFHYSRLEPAGVVGTDLVYGFILAAIGGGAHFAAGSYNGPVLLKLACGGLAGAFVGAHLSSVIPPRPLRIAISLLLVALGGQLSLLALGYWAH